MRTPASSLINGLLATSTIAITAVLADEGSNILDWATLQPSTDLEYHDCYNDFKCARLEVPLDWENTDDHHTAILAIMKYPAQVSDSDPAFGGSIFINPGGPGASGIQTLLSLASGMQHAVDIPDKKHYELITWDPRGVGFTRPYADCNSGRDLIVEASYQEERGTGGLTLGADSIRHNLAIKSADALRCAKYNPEGESIFSFMASTQHAHDLLRMVDKIDELRAKGQKKRSDAPLPRLQYIGYSYGTALGQYFAAMFPERVHRMILDSVVNVEEYTENILADISVDDADKILEQFFEACLEFGPEKCKLLRQSDKSGKDVADRFWKYIDTLHEEPKGVLSYGDFNAVFMVRDVMNAVGGFLYEPSHQFDKLANLLDGIMQGNYWPLIDNSNPVPDFDHVCKGPRDEVQLSRAQSSNLDARKGILCMDTVPTSGLDVQAWEDVYRNYTFLSAVYGEVMANNRFNCARWLFKNKNRFTGPWTTPKPGQSENNNSPSAPILFVSNRYDPVTALKSARKMSENHPGSGLVIMESSGHIVFGRTGTTCVMDAIAEYMDEGVVPDKELVCPLNCNAWDERCFHSSNGKRDVGLRFMSNMPIYV